MHGTIRRGQNIAIKAAGRTASETQRPVTDESNTDQTDSDWFTRLARALLPKDAGFALHLLSGFEERTCYRYASGDRKPPAYFLRALLRSDQGETFLGAVMEGCTSDWWVDLQRERKIGASAIAAMKP